jgi:hypothetical protein
VILALTLICRSSYRGVVEFVRDLLGLSISEGHGFCRNNDAAVKFGLPPLCFGPR